MSSSDTVFLVGIAIAVPVGLLWERCWVVIDRDRDKVKNCIHDTYDDPNRPGMGGATRRCRKCRWQIQVDDDGNPF